MNDEVRREAKERVENELKELRNKMNRLEIAEKHNAFDIFPPIQRVLLKKQLSEMRSYAETLELRLFYWED